MTTCLEPTGWLWWQQCLGDDHQNVVMDREAGCGPLECCGGLRGRPGTIKVLLWLPRLVKDSVVTT